MDVSLNVFVIAGLMVLTLIFLMAMFARLYRDAPAQLSFLKRSTHDRALR